MEIDLTQHHAYVFKGDANLVEKLRLHIEEIFNIPVEGNPDVHIDSFDHFGIDDAKKLQADQSRKALQGQVKVFIIHTRTIGEVAQNALLKVLEEPTEDTCIIFVLPQLHTLLPTLRSRVQLVYPPTEESSSYDVHTFLKLTRAERLEYVQKLIASGDKREARHFVDEITKVLHKSWKNDGYTKEGKQKLKELQMVRRYILDPSSSLKLLLEHTALMLGK